MSEAPQGAEELQKAFDKLQHEKSALEKELKKTKEVIELAKDKKSLQQALEENVKLKQEIEVLEVFKGQNAALKDHMHQIASTSDSQRVQVAQLSKEIIELKAKLPVVEGETSASTPSLDPIIKEFETTIADLRSETFKLEESLKKAQDDLAEEKKKSAEAAKSAAAPQNNTVPAASSTPASVLAKSWWGAKATTTSATALSSDSTKLEEQLKAAHSEIDKLRAQLGKNNGADNSKTALEKDPPQIEELQAEIQTLKGELAALKVSSAAAEGASALEKSLQEVREALQMTSDEANTFKAKFEAAKTQLSKVTDMELALSKATEEILSLNITLDGSKVASSSQKQEIETQLVSVTAQLAETNQSLLDHKSQLEASKSESAASKASFEKNLAELHSEKDALVSNYETTIRTLQETVAQKSIEVQALRAKDGSSDTDASSALEWTSPELESLKSGYEKDRQLANEKVTALETKVASISAELDVSRSLADIKLNELDAATKALESQLKAKDSEVETLAKTKAELTTQIDSLTKQITESGQKVGDLEARMKAMIDDLNQQHAESLKKRLIEVDSSHKLVLDQLRDELVKEKAIVEVKLSQDLASLESKHKQQTLANEESSAKASKEIEQLRKEVADLKESSSKGSKATESQLKVAEDKARKDLQALEDKRKNEMNEVSEMAKKSLADLESRLKKEFSVAEEKAVKVKGEMEEKRHKELEEKLNKEKKDMEEKFNKEKASLDEKHAKEKAKIQTDLDHVKTEVEKLKKDVAQHEQQKSEQAKKFEKELFSRNDDIGKYTTRIKTVESEYEAFKIDSAKNVADLDAKLATSIGNIARLNEDIEAEKAKYSKLESDLKKAKEDSSQIQTKLDNVSAELEVARSSSERLSKVNAEKDEQMKKQKQRTDDMLLTQNNMAKTITQLEKEKEALTHSIHTHSDKISELKAQMAHNQEEFDAARKLNIQNAEALGATIISLKTDNDALLTRIQDVQTEYRAMERKGALVIKDLQKQIVKERKRQGVAESPQSQNKSDSLDSLTAEYGYSRSRHASDSPTRKPPSKAASDGSQRVGIPKVERLTKELLQLAQENEALNKRTRHAEEEIRTLNERLNKQLEELELKSKAVQQYMLREYSSQLQPDEKPKLSPTALTTTEAMQKMNPAVLAQVNIKMQKLLEDVTSKNMALEEENKLLKKGITSTSNMMVKQSNI